MNQATQLRWNFSDLPDNLTGKRAEGDVPRVQQGRRGLHHRGGAQVRLDPPAGQGDVQGDRRDDPDGGQERGREDQLQRVPGDDGGSPTYHAW